MYDGARVSTTIASHTRWRPARHGIIVRPSGLRPSVRSRPGGSFIDGIPAFERERCIMSLIVLCLAIRPKPREQDRPWLPLASIRAPQAHICVVHILWPPGASRPPHERPRCPVSTHMLLLVRRVASRWRVVTRQLSIARCCMGLLYLEAVS